MNVVDIAELLSEPVEEADVILKQLNLQIASAKNEVQKNKVELKELKKTMGSGIDMLRLPKMETKVNPFWVASEYQLAIEGFRNLGGDFEAIAEIIGTKTPGDVKKFFLENHKCYQLDCLLDEHKAEHCIMDPVEETIDEATAVRERFDAAVEKFYNLDMDKLDIIQRKKAAALRKQILQVEEWNINAHGEYTPITYENEFFERMKMNENIVMHCYRSENVRCAILDRHLDLLCNSHTETKFCKLDVDKAPFLCDYLKIRIIPTVVICKKGRIIDFIEGFNDLGGKDDFSTELLEWRIARTGVINYNGHFFSPPESNAASGSATSMET